MGMDIVSTSASHSPLPADSEVLILSLLADGPMYGYAISKRVAAASENQVRLTPGVLYPLLASLEKRGLITSLWEVIRAERPPTAGDVQGANGEEAKSDSEEPSRGRRRKWYRLSARGASHLERRIAAHRAHVAMIERFLSPRPGTEEGAQA